MESIGISTTSTVPPKQNKQPIKWIALFLVILAITVYGVWKTFGWGLWPIVSSDYNAIIIGDNVRVRSSPELNGDVIHTFNTAELVNITDRTNERKVITNDNGCDAYGYHWYKIYDTQGRVGWVYGKYIFHLRGENSQAPFAFPHPTTEYIDIDGNQYHFDIATDMGYGPDDVDGLTGCDTTFVMYLHKKGSSHVEPVYYDAKRFPVDVWNARSKLFLMMTYSSEGEHQVIETLNKHEQNPRDVIELRVATYEQDGGRNDVLKIGMQNNRFNLSEYIEGKYHVGSDIEAMEEISQENAKEKIAELTKFDKETVMYAIFGAYNKNKGGSLLPKELTPQWDEKGAETVATPLLVSTYVEGGETMGVILVQTLTGSIAGRAQPASISIYLFKKKGNKWVFDKRREDVNEFGSAGTAPGGGRLIRLGDDKYGVLFEGTYIGQGYMSMYSAIIGLSDGAPKSQVFNTGENNSGACSSDHQEQEELGLKECWEHIGKIEFLRNTGSDYYIMRITESGTANDDEGGKVKDINTVSYLLNEGGNYKSIGTDTIKNATQVPKREVFVSQH